MDRPTLIKIRSKKNVFLFISITFVATLIFIAYFTLFGIFKLNNVILIIVIISILFVVTGIPAVYYYTTLDGYERLYNIKDYSTSDYRSYLDIITKDKIIIPHTFFSKNNNFKKIYCDGIYSYLGGFPNASLPTIVRCLEVGLKEKYSILKKQKKLNELDTSFLKNINNHIQTLSNKHKKTINDINLFNLIESAKGYYKNKKETLQYLRSLRNFIHEDNIIKDNDAYSALIKITDILNILFELPEEININVKCKVCNLKHQYTINSSEYYIGNKKEFRCKNRDIQEDERSFNITLMPRTP